MLLQDQMKIVRDHQKTAPVQVVNLANALGLPVYEAGGWTGDISGMIVKDDGQYNADSGYAVFVNKDHGPTRKRFTIAHETAHFIRHKDQIGDGISDDGLYRSGLSNRTEAEANALAADILMPWELINNAMANGVKTIEDLAKHFEVSRSAMSIRLGVPYERVT